MPFDSVQIAHLGGAWGAMGSLAGSDGSANHPYLRRLIDDIEPQRDLSDAVHYICLLHGRYPGVIDHALQHARMTIESGWIEAAAEAFAGERAYLVRLVAAAGPLPPTPAPAESHALPPAHRPALDLLAHPLRAGPPPPAAVALAIDWTTIRQVLDTAAHRFGIAPFPSTLPLAEETVSVVDAMARECAIERAMLFGAQQVYAQHRGLWDLLEARAGARNRG